MKRISYAAHRATLAGSLLVAALAARAAPVVDSRYIFKGTPDGSEPTGGFVADGHGNFFGTTQFGGKYPYGTAQADYGTVFELKAMGQGNYAYKKIYDVGGADGQAFPAGPAAVDQHGHLYVVTQLSSTGSRGVLELVPQQDGSYQLGKKILFNGQYTGPVVGVAVDANGNLFASGTIHKNGAGYLFELTPAGNHWTITKLYRNGGSSVGLTLAPNGDLFGMSFAGGQGHGTVLRYHKQGSVWVQTIIHSFDATAGSGPSTRPVLDSAGNLYGTTPGYGGSTNTGTVFKLTRPAGGDGRNQEWPMTVLHTFTATDGGNPQQPLLAADGSLYGLTSEAGTGACGCGTIFKLSPNGSGWDFTLLWTFQGGDNGNGGYGPLASDGAGHLFGATTFGGSKHLNPFGNGTLFSFAE